MKRPIFVLLIGLVLGEAAVVSMGAWGLCIPVFLILPVGLYAYGMRKRRNRFFYSAYLNKRFKREEVTYDWVTIAIVIISISFLVGGIRFLCEWHEGAWDQILKKEEQKGYIRGEIVFLQTGKSGAYQIDLGHVTFYRKDTDQEIENTKRNHVSIRLDGKCRINGIIADGSLSPGMRIECPGSLSVYEDASNPGGFRARIYYASKGIYYGFYAKDVDVLSVPYFSVKRLVYAWKERFKAVYGSLLSEEDAGLLDAIVLGEKSSLSEDVRSLYEENGVAHLLAVSGLHISIFGGSIYKFLRKRGFTYVLSCLTGGFILILYGMMTGFGSSVMRAISMYLFYLLSEWIGADYDMISAMSLSGILMLLEYPWRILDSGFQISFVSIFAIGGVLPFVMDLQVKRQRRDYAEGEIPPRVYQVFYEVFFTGIVLSAVTLPVVLYYYYQWSPYSLVLNLILIPLMTPVMITAIFGGVTGACSLVVGAYTIIPARLLLLFYRLLLTLTRRLPGSLMITGCPGLSGVLLLYAIEALLVYLWYAKNKKLMFLSFILLSACCFLSPEKKLRIVMLDIGQGECILVMPPNGDSLLIDGGSTSRKDTAKYVIEPALKYYGVSRLHYVVMTHMDEDHISGIVELLQEGYPVESVILSDLKEEEEVYTMVKNYAIDDQANVWHFRQGDGLDLGDVHMTCLHPTADYISEDRNDGSVCLHLQYYDFDMLFTGDIGEIGEEELRKYIEMNGMDGQMNGSFHNQNSRLDILKIAHHGSKYSTSDAWLDLLRPQCGILSCGKKNRYGHPHQELLDRFEARHIPVFRTDQDGAILIETDGRTIDISKWICYNE